MSSELPNEVLIGACCDWRHPDWLGPFYPEDMPPEWQIAYYANNYRALGLTQGLWQEAATLAELVEETPDHFYFFPVVQQAEVMNVGWETHFTTLSGKLGAVIIEPPQSLLDDDDRFAEYCANRWQGVPWVLSVKQERLSARQLQIVQGHGVSLCWHGDGEPVWGHGGLAVTRLEGGSAWDLPQLRRCAQPVIDAWRADKLTAVIFSGNPPHLKNMDNLSVILSLL